MNPIFTMRMKPEVARKLELLAQATQRSKANAIAWLILKTPIPENNSIDTTPEASPERGLSSNG